MNGTVEVVDLLHAKVLLVKTFGLVVGLVDGLKLAVSHLSVYLLEIAD